MPRPAHPAAELEVREGRALGSRLRLVAATSPRLDAAWAAIVEEFAAVDVAMSRFRADSEVTVLNRQGGAVAVSRRLRTALSLTDRARRLTAGRFDPRVLRSMEQLGFTGAEAGESVGNDASPRAAGGRVYEPVEAEPGGWRGRARIRLSAPVDLGGIGKGLALRWAADAASRHLADEGFLLDAGGDIVARGTVPPSIAGGCWSVGVEDPVRASEAQGGPEPIIAPEPIATCSVPGGMALATSSTRVARRTSRDGPIHHLIDPATGLPGGAGLLAVTVLWPDPAWAEVWSKALFLAGGDRIAAEARRRGLSAWWVDTDGLLAMTPAARQRTTWVRAEASAAS